MLQKVLYHIWWKKELEDVNVFNIYDVDTLENAIQKLTDIKN